MLAMLPVDDHRHAASREVERNLVHLRVRLVDRQFFLQLRVLQNGDVEEVLQPSLVKAVEVGEGQHRVVLFTHDVHMPLENDLVLR